MNTIFARTVNIRLYYYSCGKNAPLDIVAAVNNSDQQYPLNDIRVV